MQEITDFQVAGLLCRRPLPIFDTMATYPHLIRFRINSGSLLTRSLPRAEAVAC